MRKLTFIGRGNAGCLMALHYAYYTRDKDDIEIELIYNPDIPPERVGQGTVLEVPRLLWKALGIDWFRNPINATPKFGILYENWGKKNKHIFTPFDYVSTALHYNPQKLQETIINSGFFKVKEANVESYDEIDSTFIFDCRGKVTDWTDYRMLDNPVNAALLCQTNTADLKAHWTRAVATPHGWTFVIPNTTNTTSYGYLYNDTLTSVDEAADNFEELFNIKEQGVTLDKIKDNLRFKNYVSTRPIIDNRIILGGNRLFFLEPLEATAIQTYLHWARHTFDFIVDGTRTAKDSADMFKIYIHQLETFIGWHYKAGSIYDTPFWKKAKKYKTQDKKFDEILRYVRLTPKESLRDESLTGHGLVYGQWSPFNFSYWNEGING